MAIVTRAFDYHVNGATFDGAVVLDEAQAGKRPAVMVFHGWEGRSDAQVEVARSLARLGYIGFACDLFGKGIRGQVTGDNSGLIAPFLQDRAMLRTRLVNMGQLSAFYRKTAFTRRSGGSKEGRNLGPDEFQRRETGTRA